MIACGAILLLIGIVGASNGVADKEYAEDWVAWLFFVILGLVGFLMVMA